MTAEQPHRSEATGQVVMFRPRAALQRGGDRFSGSPKDQDAALIGDLRNYEHTEETDDYRHRMITNAIAFIFIVMLTAAGVWLAETLSAIRKNQDCLLQGRRNCAPIAIHSHDR